MNITIQRVILSFILIMSGSGLYAAPLFAGKWQGKVNGPFSYPIAMNLVMDGSGPDGPRLTGIVYTPLGEDIILGTKIKGDEFSFSIDANGMQSLYNGKVDGDKITLKIQSWLGEMNAELIRLDSKTPFTVFMKPEHTEFWEPVPPTVVPAPYAAATGIPSDAIILFDGRNLDAWQGTDGGKAKWEMSDNAFTVKKGTGDIQTKQSFNDYQLHIEWLIPANIEGEGQARGNSGILMQGIYELQVLDSYNNKTYVNGQAGSMYKQAAPLVNAIRKPGEWNVYDIVYTAPRFNEKGSLAYPARITVFHNDILIQNNLEITGNTAYIGLPKYTPHGKGPIRLQDHGDPSRPVSFRNIWIREL